MQQQQQQQQQQQCDRFHIGFFGPIGSGKSSLINTLMKLLYPSLNNFPAPALANFGNTPRTHLCTIWEKRYAFNNRLVFYDLAGHPERFRPLESTDESTAAAPASADDAAEMTREDRIRYFERMNRIMDGLPLNTHLLSDVSHVPVDSENYLHWAVLVISAHDLVREEQTSVVESKAGFWPFLSSRQAVVDQKTYTIADYSQSVWLHTYRNLLLRLLNPPVVVITHKEYLSSLPEAVRKQVLQQLSNYIHSYQDVLFIENLSDPLLQLDESTKKTLERLVTILWGRLTDDIHVSYGS